MPSPDIPVVFCCWQRPTRRVGSTSLVSPPQNLKWRPKTESWPQWHQACPEISWKPPVLLHEEYIGRNPKSLGCVFDIYLMEKNWRFPGDFWAGLVPLRP